jgi:hypothetical protein
MHRESGCETATLEALVSAAASRLRGQGVKVMPLPSWSRLRLAFALLLLVVAAAGAAAEAAGMQATPGQRLSRGPNTWSASSPAGVALTGTWTVVIDDTSGSATGTWTLTGANRQPSARGTWSAAKTARGWSGAWRARSAGSAVEYSGAWTASMDVAADASLGRLFERALQSVVSGRWSVGTQSGVWSIRAFD